MLSNSNNQALAEAIAVFLADGAEQAEAEQNAGGFGKRSATTIAAIRTEAAGILATLKPAIVSPSTATEVKEEAALVPATSAVVNAATNGSPVATVGNSAWSLLIPGTVVTLTEEAAGNSQIAKHELIAAIVTAAEGTAGAIFAATPGMRHLVATIKFLAISAKDRRITWAEQPAPAEDDDEAAKLFAKRDRAALKEWKDNNTKAVIVWVRQGKTTKVYPYF